MPCGPKILQGTPTTADERNPPETPRHMSDNPIRTEASSGQVTVPLVLLNPNQLTCSTVKTATAFISRLVFSCLFELLQAQMFAKTLTAVTHRSSMGSIGRMSHANPPGIDEVTNTIRKAKTAANGRPAHAVLARVAKSTVATKAKGRAFPNRVSKKPAAAAT